MRTIYIVNGKIVLPDKVEENKVLVLRQGKIEGLSTDVDFEPSAEIIDARGGYILPGFIDIHVHGGGGADFMDGTLESFQTIVNTHFLHGTTALLPTSVAASREEMQAFFDLYRRAEKIIDTVDLLGIHLEGPYISQEMKGAQNPAYVRDPSKEETDWIVENADIVSRITVAPELKGAKYLAERCIPYGVKLCIGHSNAVGGQVLDAVRDGFNHITHLYSNTPSVRKINQKVYAGIVEAAFLSDDITVELIGDGCHVAKETMQMVLKVKGTERVALITDAMRAAGTNVNESYLGTVKPENRVIIEDGVAKLPDRSFYAGSIATMDRVVQNAILRYGLPVVDVCKIVSLTPARLAGVEKRKGSLEVGKDADVVITDEKFQVQKVISCKYWR